MHRLSLAEYLPTLTCYKVITVVIISQYQISGALRKAGRPHAPYRGDQRPAGESARRLVWLREQCLVYRPRKIRLSSRRSSYRGRMNLPEKLHHKTDSTITFYHHSMYNLAGPAGSWPAYHLRTPHARSGSNVSCNNYCCYLQRRVRSRRLRLGHKPPAM